MSSIVRTLRRRANAMMIAPELILDLTTPMIRTTILAQPIKSN